jgi:hypothetical protein
MSLNTKSEIWLTLVGEKYPALTENQLMDLRLQAASESYMGGDGKLSKLFDQYVMLKALKGL